MHPGHRLIWLVLLPLFVSESALASEVSDAPPSEQRLSISGYGSANYYAFDWETDPQRRNAIDLERLTIEPRYRLSDRVALNAEFEIEHGGTAATLEFDPFEEFGEFEIEIEKGGEVVLEQMNVEIGLTSSLNLKVGRLKIPFGHDGVDDEPLDYFTTTRSETETHLVPTPWYEDGIQFTGSLLKDLDWFVSVTNGLDSSGFSSASWIVGGHQLRFETVNASDLAASGRLEWHPSPTFGFGATGYFGNTTHNRPKPDLDADGIVGVAELHGEFSSGPWTARALLVEGSLENADLISAANRNLSNNLNVKRTPVGSRATGWVAEAGWDVGSVVPAFRAPVVIFGRYERYDTMAKVSGEVFDNPRWDREVVTGGINVHLAAPVVMKAQYSHRHLGTNTVNDENTFSMGIGFEF